MPDNSPGAVASSEAENPKRIAYVAIVNELELSPYLLQVRMATEDGAEMEYRLRHGAIKGTQDAAKFYRNVMSGLLTVFGNNQRAIADCFASIVNQLQGVSPAPIPEVPV